MRNPRQPSALPRAPRVVDPDRRRDELRRRYHSRGTGRDIDEDGRYAFVVAGALGVTAWYRAQLIPMARAIGGRKPLPPVEPFDPWMKRALRLLDENLTEMEKVYGELQQNIRLGWNLGTISGRQFLEHARTIESFRELRLGLRATYADRREWMSEPPFAIARAAFELAHALERGAASREQLTARFRAVCNERGYGGDQTDLDLFSEALSMTALLRELPALSAGHPTYEGHAAFVAEVQSRFARLERGAATASDIAELWGWHAHDPSAKTRKAWLDRLRHKGVGA